jgi:hypothetical protein
MTTEFQREQEERRETLENDCRVREQQRGSTFMEHTNDLDLGGRFAKQTPQTVVGSKPVTNYPQGPA